MKINLINYEAAFQGNGILTKFAERMRDELLKLGHLVNVTPYAVEDFDIYHHINYLPYDKGEGINTLMITHINFKDKLERLRQHMRTADKGICMSEQMIDELVAEGFDRGKLTFVLPAHDGDFVPIPVAILTNVYPDGCKREEMLINLCKKIDKSRFLFRIMGKSWNTDALQRDGINFEYYPEFNRSFQNGFLQDSKYYLYFGLDQGSMALLDAKRAGCICIAPDDGFDRGLVDLPFTTQKELNDIFLKIQEPKIPDWTWENYTKKHVEIWGSL